MGRREDVRDEGWGGAVGATDRQLYYVVLEMLCRPKANAQRSECAALRMTTVHGPMRIAVKLHAPWSSALDRTLGRNSLDRTLGSARSCYVCALGSSSGARTLHDRVEPPRGLNFLNLSLFASFDSQ